jgi:hypothetical protein
LLGPPEGLSATHERWPLLAPSSDYLTQADDIGTRGVTALRCSHIDWVCLGGDPSNLDVDGLKTRLLVLPSIRHRISCCRPAHGIMATKKYDAFPPRSVIWLTFDGVDVPAELAGAEAIRKSRAGGGAALVEHLTPPATTASDGCLRRRGVAVDLAWIGFGVGDKFGNCLGRNRRIDALAANVTAAVTCHWSRICQA